MLGAGEADAGGAEGDGVLGLLGGVGKRRSGSEQNSLLTTAATLARFWPEMPYEIRITDNAREDFLALDARRRSAVKAAMEAHLRHEPAKASKSRIKRLRGLRQPQYRLRVDTIRVYYDIAGDHVNVLGIVPKDRAADWLAQCGEPL